MTINKDEPIVDYIQQHDCVICLDPLYDEEEHQAFRNFECNRHLVHMECYKLWRQSNSKHNCPLC